LIDEKTNEEKRIGNQTECSMLDFINRSLRKIQSEAKHYDTIRSQHKILQNIPFNSTTKKMTVVVELERDKTVRVYTKGASECIVDDCLNMIAKDGQLVDLDATAKEQLKETTLK
jgi:magnesium-transporting ATPase (P-type)